MIWWLAFEKKPFQFWQEIWIQVVVILLQLYISNHFSNIVNNKKTWFSENILRFRLLCKSMTSLISTTQECRLECAIFFWTSVFFYSNCFEFYLFLFCDYFILELYIFLICSFMYFQVRQFPLYLTFWNQKKSVLLKILATWVNLSLAQYHQKIVPLEVLTT